MVATEKKIQIKLRVFELDRAQARQPLRELTPLEVLVPFNEPHDRTRQRVEEHARSRTGRKVRSVSSLVDGSFAVIIDPN
jgi:hypothetical protein